MKLLISLGSLALAIVFTSLEVLAQESAQVLNEVVVLSSPLSSTLFESIEPTTVLSGSELLNSSESSLGETLAKEPGVASSYFGPGASRPVIRGLSGERIRILENGIGSQDVSAISPDHLSTVEPALTDRIEVIRGPATILYGTSAVGGIVNIYDGRIPENLPEDGLAGRIETRGGTADLERSLLGKFDIGEGPFVFHLDGFKRRSDDVNIPGFARTSAKREQQPELKYPEPKGELPYSDTDSNQLTLGTSYVVDQGFLGVAISEFNSVYGVPNGEEDISIDAQRQRFDLKGKLFDVSEHINSLSMNLGIVDYDHTEFEGEEEGTIFKNQGIDSRFELAHNKITNLEGVVGLHFQNSDFEAIGEEAYQPPTTADIYSLFVFEEYQFKDAWKFQLGARYDWSEYDSDGFENNPEFEQELGRARPGAAQKSFDTFSQSAGIVYNPTQHYALALSLSHTERAPSGQELFADGGHIATAAYEIGDQNLEEERSLGIDLTLKKTNGRIAGSIGGFYNRFWDYIGLNPNGEQALGLDVYQFENQDAEFLGIESKIEFRFCNYEDFLFSADIQPDFTYARDIDSKEPLPRIPPFRVKSGLNYKNPDLINARLEVQFNDSQQRNAEFETETDSYTFLNLLVSKAFIVESKRFEVFLRGTNLSNAKARESTSFIKDVAPLPGASVVGGLRFFF